MDPIVEPGNFWRGWGERLSALRHVPPVLAIVWRSGPPVVALGLVFRLLASTLPIALLWIAKLIIDSIVHAVSNHQPVQSGFWWLVAAEFGLAICASVLGRTIDYLDALLADKYTRYVSIKVIKHSAELDLAAYEDPVFYDRLERARVQATDRLGMIQSIGRLVQQAVTAVSLSVSILLFSPWLLFLLVLSVIPGFLGESHFAFLGYATIHRQTPIRRQLDYLRVLGGSREAAKELKLFGLRSFSLSGSLACRTRFTRRMSAWRADGCLLVRSSRWSAPRVTTPRTCSLSGELLPELSASEN